LADIDPLDWEPLTGLAPDQAPEATHPVVLVLVQLSTEAFPELTVLGLA
jgi:hypothetical protein